MKKGVFILPYFGKFNNYFQLFLDSCSMNKEFDWIIFTDDKTTYKYPKNVIVNYLSFDEIVLMIKNKFQNIKVCMDSPYKFCDLKPMYGYIFEEYIKDYDYWGHCDNDLIFGRIVNFFDFSLLGEYDKIGFLGHFSLFKNNYDNNRLFMKSKKYIEVLENSKPFKFDEEFNNSVNNIYLDNGKKIYTDEFYADIYVKSSNFKLTHFNIDINDYYTDKKDKSFFIWNNGILLKYKLDPYSHKYFSKEYLYIHLQKRNMDVNIDVNSYNKIFKIIPNSFEYLECPIEKIDESTIKTKNFNLHYFRIRFKNLCNKIKKYKLGE